MAQEMYQYIESKRPQHLTIADVKGLNPGDQLDVVIWDRNFEEYWIWSSPQEEGAKNERAYDAQEFFKKNHHRLVYRGDMKWDIHFQFGEVFEHPVHVDTSKLETNWSWCAIADDGCIHITNEMVYVGEEIPGHWKPKHMHWKEFADETRVGWRGPIMLWKDVDGQVYKRED